jgi:hypothetical protein
MAKHFALPSMFNFFSHKYINLGRSDLYLFSSTFELDVFLFVLQGFSLLEYQVLDGKYQTTS